MKSRFRGIRVAAGYSSDLGENVHHLRESNFEAGELPALNIIDRANGVEHFSLSQFVNTLDIDLEVKVSSASTTFRAAYGIMGDVYMAIAEDDTWGGLAIDTRPVSDEIDVHHAGRVVAGVTIRIQVQYEAEKWTF